MGDIADLLVSNFDNYDDILMSAPKTRGRNYYTNKPKEIVCKYCKQRNLFWHRAGEIYRLIDKNHKLHECDFYRKAK